VVHVNDASRAVTVVGNLLQKDTSATYKQSIKQDYETFRTKFKNRAQHKEYTSIKEARDNKLQIDWSATDIIRPDALGIQVIDDLDLELLLPYIDWTPFFRSWELHGKYPAILSDAVVGKQATELFSDAQEMLKEVVENKLLRAKGIFGLFKANSINEDDIEIEVENERFIFRTLRQQLKKREGAPNFALSDFIAPKDQGLQDYMGCFCVSTGFGTDELALEYQKNHDDYNAILIKALADRLAEAFAEYLHKEVRVKHWGYAKDEQLPNKELIKESYIGIRPAPGYPACPDHLEKLTFWEVLGVKEKIGVELTEGLAMWPAASVSGYYFANPKARYFGVGKIKEDQVEDFAKRKGITIEVATKWLAPNIVDD
jgi:5-methyltetrahydrofolate--homocysteine methyltransferase